MSIATQDALGEEANRKSVPLSPDQQMIEDRKRAWANLYTSQEQQYLEELNDSAASLTHFRYDNMQKDSNNIGFLDILNVLSQMKELQSLSISLKNCSIWNSGLVQLLQQISRFQVLEWLDILIVDGDITEISFDLFLKLIPKMNQLRFLRLTFGFSCTKIVHRGIPKLKQLAAQSGVVQKQIIISMSIHDSDFNSNSIKLLNTLTHEIENINFDISFFWSEFELDTSEELILNTHTENMFPVVFCLQKLIQFQGIKTFNIFISNNNQFYDLRLVINAFATTLPNLRVLNLKFNKTKSSNVQQPMTELAKKINIRYLTRKMKRLVGFEFDIQKQQGTGQLFNFM